MRWMTESEVRRPARRGRIHSLLCGLMLAVWAVPAVAQRAPERPAASTAPAAEQTLADGQWFQREIGQGVTWRYCQFENLYGTRQSVSVLEADLNSTGVVVSFPYLARARGRVSEFVPAQRPDAVGAVNGTYFDTTPEGGGAVTFLRINGQVITPEGEDFGSYGVQSAVTIDDKGVVRIEPRPQTGWNNYTARRDVMANGPLLLLGGKTQDFGHAGDLCTNRHPRTMAGVTADHRLILVTVDGRNPHAAGMTCEEMARLMAELGCVDALNLDGGGSTTMWVAGEPGQGVVNFPSDNGVYDHEGERPCANAIAVSAPPARPAPWDARLREVHYSKAMTAGTTQLVTLEYENLGTETWTRERTSLVVTRPRTRVSELLTTGSWVTTTTPALLEPAEVPPGGTGRFSFVLTAPALERSRIFSETFGLMQEGIGPFGPPDNEPRLEILAYPPEPPTTGTFIIESRIGGQYYSRYSDTGGWGDSSTNCTAPGLTPGIGQRYASTFRTRVGTKRAIFRPNFARSGTYRVYVAYGDGGRYARDGVTCKVTDARGTSGYKLDQTRNANTWVLLGTHVFHEGQEGFVLISNEELNLSGNMYVAAVKFEPVDP